MTIWPSKYKDNNNSWVRAHRIKRKPWFRTEKKRWHNWNFIGCLRSFRVLCLLMRLVTVTDVWISLRGGKVSEVLVHSCLVPLFWTWGDTEHHGELLVVEQNSSLDGHQAKRAACLYAAHPSDLPPPVRPTCFSSFPNTAAFCESVGSVALKGLSAGTCACLGHFTFKP